MIDDFDVSPCACTPTPTLLLAWTPAPTPAGRREVVAKTTPIIGVAS